jgi:hypothetical protein
VTRRYQQNPLKKEQWWGMFSFTQNQTNLPSDTVIVHSAVICGASPFIQPQQQTCDYSLAIFQVSTLKKEIF